MSSLSSRVPFIASTAIVAVLAGTSACLLGAPGARASTTRGMSTAVAGKHVAQANHVLAARMSVLHRCKRLHPVRCTAQQRAVKQAAARLAGAKRMFATVRGVTVAKASSITPAPTVVVSGQTVSWTAMRNVSSYVFVRKVAGQADQYSTVSGTSTTPPALPGTTVRFSVRANVTNSAWAPEVSITYAPKITVSGQTLSWTAISSVSSYVFVRKVPGQADQYSTVSGTSTAPPAVPGTTVHFSVRANVTNSLWASEVSISYPATPPVAPPPTTTTTTTSAPPPTTTTTTTTTAPPTTTTATTTTTTTTAPPTTTSTTTSTSSTSPPAPGLQTGVVAGSALSWEMPFIQQEGARTARMEFAIGTPASQIAPIVGAYAAAGIRPMLLAGFYGRLPTTAEAQNLATWAAQFGTGGGYWQGKTEPPGTAVTDIEFGNETSYSYQFSDNSSSTFAARAQTYALRFKDAQTAIQAANPKVGLLATADNSQGGTAWVSNMFKAVPDLGQRVAGWTIHPYGPNWASQIDSTVSSTAAAGAPSTVPIWVTEWGLSSDNGRCLDDNYGYDKCMTYSAAATTLQSALSGMQSRYGSRLGAFFMYQAHDQADSGTQSGREYYFGGVQLNGASKGAYTTAVKAILAAGS